MSREPSPVQPPDEDQKAQLLRLRFDEPLEQQFRVSYELGARTSRVIIMVIGMLMMGVTPLYDATLLQAPEAFLKLSHLMQFGVQIPAIAVALLITVLPRLARWSIPATIGSTTIAAIGLTAQHVAGYQNQFNVPHDFPAMTVAGMLILGRLRFRTALPWAVLTMCGVSAAQIWLIGLPTVYDTISAWMLIVVAAISAYLLEYSARQSWYRGRLLEYLATRDGLTGLPNRRHFDVELRRLVRDAMRQQRNVAVMILDVDHFKAYNDRYGHPAGDRCLNVVGEWLSLSMRRPQDFCARIGGEEFAAVWYDASPEVAVQLAESLREGINGLARERGIAGAEDVNASGGFAQVIAPSPSVSPDRITADLVQRADIALYSAKRAGRSRLVFSDSDHYTDLKTGSRIDG
ncbi:MAG: diguanylate cyclase [Nevskia sp.]|uniref:diguanylate cyclase n=1 Tax=Nevskia sp. TaxID=1929292 RepID=UPI0040356A6E